MRLHDGSIAVPLYGKWLRRTEEQLEAMKVAGGDSALLAEMVVERDYMQYENGLSVYLPHGVAWSAKERVYDGGSIVLPPSNYPEKFGNDGVAFCNDRQSDYLFMVAPRKTGKSSLGAAALGYRVLKCDPTWPCFAENGIEHIPWTGPKVLTIASFSWDNVSDLWKVYQEVWPRDELGDFAKGGKRTLTFGDGRTKSLTTAKSGTELRFLCYTQMQHAWENLKCHYHHADEQEPLAKLSALEDGQRTMGKTQIFFTLSGFVLDDRPDTGEAGELKRGIYDGTRTRGKVVGRYHNDIPSTPDVVISEEKKRQIFDQYANPKLARSKKEERRAKAVYWPGWEPRGAMVFDADCWDRAVHVINPLWEDDTMPKGMTLWRSIDYGSAKGTNVCSWWAVAPFGKLLEARPALLAGVPAAKRGEVYAVLYRVLYETGMEIADMCKEVIARSGNERVEVGELRDSATGNTYQYWQEEYKREAFWGGTLLDPRSAAQSQQGQTLEEIFSRYGLKDVRPANAQKDMIQIPRLKDWLRIDWGKDHPFRRDAAGAPMKGCPRLFVFDGRAQAGVAEIEGLRKPDDTQLTRSPTQYINKDDAHHFVDTAKYWASDSPRFMGDDLRYRDGDSEPDAVNAGSEFTAY